MNNFVTDQLDESISALLAGGEPASASDAQLRDLLQIAAELRTLPRPAFRARLRADLLSAMERRAACPERAQRVEGSSPVGAAQPRSSDCDTMIPPLFSTGSGTLPIRGSHLALSFGLHVIALGLVAASGWWMVENHAVVRAKVAQLVPGSEDYLLPVAPRKIGGGGGGGTHDKLDASHGTPPRFASEQLTPPAVVVRNEDPKLAAEPTVIGPPNVILPQSDKYGDPMANILNPPSNGPGSGGGIGSGHGGGVGAGEGPGVGEGRGGGIGGGVFHVGGGVTAPRAIYDPDPEYSEEARKAKYQGSVLLLAIIGPNGRPRDLRVQRSLGMGLDQKALDAVWKWRFAPALKDGRPVSVAVSIEVDFRLY
jgi:periplasmic protein TonB